MIRKSETPICFHREAQEQALLRAAKVARQRAIQTNTPLVVLRDGLVVKIPPEELQAQLAAEEARSRNTGE